MKHRALLLAALAVAMTAASAKPAKVPTPAWSGIYSNVRMSAVTGDLGGQEIRFFNDPKSGVKMVEFVFCEGWCNQSYTVPLRDDAKGQWFEYLEQLYDGDGKEVAGDTHRFFLSRKGKLLVLRAEFEGEQGIVKSEPYRLKPAKQLFGIDVANNVP